MPTVVQSDLIATNYLGLSGDYGLKVPAWMDGTYSAAFSVRRLLQSYAGPLMRVYRADYAAFADLSCASGEWLISTSSICTVVTPGSSGWTIGQTMTLATFASTQDVVVQIWYDQSGNGHDLAVGTSYMTLAPKLMTAGAFETVGDFPCVKCDGNNDVLTTATGAIGRPAWVQAQPFSVAAVVQVATSGSWRTVWSRKASGSSNPAGVFYAYNSTNPDRAITAGTQVDDTNAVGDSGLVRAYGARYNGASSAIWVDGAETATGNAGSSYSAEDLEIGRAYWGSYSGHKYLELVVLPNVTDSMADLHSKMRAFYGLD